MFCVLFVGKYRGNRTQAYMEAYNGKSRGLSYLAVRQSASQLLTNPHVQKRCRELIDNSGITAEKLDSKLLFLVDQMEDYKASLGAIKEGNALLGRTSQQSNINILNYEQFLTKIEVNSPENVRTRPANQKELQRVPALPPKDQEQKEPAYSICPEWRPDDIGNDNGQSFPAAEAIKADNPES